MNIEAYLQTGSGQKNTVSEIKRLFDEISGVNFFGMYAYATQSGLAAFSHKLTSTFWQSVESRWLVGIDYGRSQPKALRELSQRANAKVRVYDGEWVLQQHGFIPRKDYHLKSALISNEVSGRRALITGSGNFSESGLRRNVEAGASIIITSGDFNEYINEANRMWDQGTPLENIIDPYEERWFSSNSRRQLDPQEISHHKFSQSEIFWIEAGYVTKNRSLSPGNQIDLPRGSKNFFGYRQRVDNPNTIIGPITFHSPMGDVITRNIRLGNNMMEKITLPTPENHGFGMYDGKVLVFRKNGTVFDLFALEAESFESVFGENFGVVSEMNSGRRFGLIG